MGALEELQQAIIEGNAPLARTLAEDGLKQGIPPADLLSRAIAPAMDEVGRRMSSCEYFIPEVLIAARAARGVAEILRPLLVDDASVRPAGTVAIGTVRGDLHDIGKNIVSMLLETAGFRVLDLGVNVSPEKFVQAVRDQKAGIIAMSALLTTTMLNMKEVIQALESAGLRHQVRIMAGGAPVTEDWVRSMGGDAYGIDAPAAVSLARQWTGLTP